MVESAPSSQPCAGRTRPPRGPGTAPLIRTQALLDVDGVDRDVLGGDGVAAHAAGHAHALEDAARGGAGTDGAGLAVVAVGTVRGADAGEAVTLHDTGEALALAGADRRRWPGRPRTCSTESSWPSGRTRRRPRCGSRPRGGAGVDAGLGEVTGLRLVDLAAARSRRSRSERRCSRPARAVRTWVTTLVPACDDGHRDDACCSRPRPGSCRAWCPAGPSRCARYSHVGNLRA